MMRGGRRGFALFVAILAVTLLGALIIAVHVSVAVDRSLADGAVLRQRAFSAAEYALWSQVSEWDSSYAALAPGAAAAKTVYAGTDSAVLTILRLDDSLFWLKSAASVGPPSRPAMRASGVSIRIFRDSSGVQLARPLARYGWLSLR